MSEDAPATRVDSSQIAAPRQRKRLRGWLIAAGMTEAAAAKRLANALLASGEALGVAGWIDRIEARLPREGAGEWLAGLAAANEAAERLSEAPVRGPGDAGAGGRGGVPLLPSTELSEMERQPLGRLPAVLRGGAWVLANRWSLPNRVGPRISRSLWMSRSVPGEPAVPPGSE